MSNNEDRRVRKTRKAMTDALAELLLEKPLNNISVREISELADINRGTFYLHYRDVYDMVEKLQLQIFERFNRIIADHEQKTGTDELFPMLAELFNLLAENSKLARVFIGKNGDAAFVDKLKNALRDTCFSDAKKLFNIKNSDDFEYLFNYIISGCIGLCSAWLDNDMNKTPTEMASFAEGLILHGAQMFI